MTRTYKQVPTSIIDAIYCNLCGEPIINGVKLDLSPFSTQHTHTIPDPPQDDYSHSHTIDPPPDDSPHTHIPAPPQGVIEASLFSKSQTYDFCHPCLNKIFYPKLYNRRPNEPAPEKLIFLSPPLPSSRSNID